MPIPKPKSGERMSDYMQRCMSDDKMISEYPNDQRAAVCRSTFEEKLASEKISFDYDGTISTNRGENLATEYISKGADVYIISARSSKEGMLSKANKLGIPESRVYATGSNEKKIKKVKELNISKHYDNNQDVINALDGIGVKF